MQCDVFPILAGKGGIVDRRTHCNNGRVNGLTRHRLHLRMRDESLCPSGYKPRHTDSHDVSDFSPLDGFARHSLHNCDIFHLSRCHLLSG